MKVLWVNGAARFIGDQVRYKGELWTIGNIMNQQVRLHQGDAVIFVKAFEIESP